MASRNWRRLVRLGWTIGLACVLCMGCGQSEPLGGPVAIAVRPHGGGWTDTPIGQPPAAAAEVVDHAEPAPIYDEQADGKKLIEAALEQARRHGTHVLIEWGGNACGWCHMLHDVFLHDQLVAPLLDQNYDLVLVDAGANEELMRSYVGQDTGLSFPYLTVLDAEGKVLTNQNTEPLEDGPQHDPQKVADFLKKWQAPAVDAQQRLAEALRQATDEDKRVLVHFGTPYCGWCTILTDFLDEHKAILSLDYVDLPIDTLRMQHGEEIEERLVPKESESIPEMVILDASGKVLATSQGPGGNIGFPYRPEEIDHFIAMLAGTKQRLVDQDLQRIRADLNTFRSENEKERAERRE